VLRARVTDGDDDDSTVELRALPLPDTPARWRTTEGVRIELDVVGSKEVPSAKLDGKPDRGEIEQVEQRALKLSKLFISARRRSSTTRCRAGPRWTASPCSARSTRASRTSSPRPSRTSSRSRSCPCSDAIQFVELSFKVEPDQATVAEQAFHALLDRLGIGHDGDPEPKTPGCSGSSRSACARADPGRLVRAPRRAQRDTRARRASLSRRVARWEDRRMAIPNISVRHPRQNDIVDDPVEVAGVGTGFEGSLVARLRNAAGQEIAQRSFQAGGTGIWGNFFFRIDVPSVPNRPRGTLEIFEVSAKDGSEIHKRVVPILYGRALVDPYQGFTVYTVKPGDTLSSIAQEFYGDPDRFRTIFQANRNVLDDPDEIFPGQELRIPQ
jgi:hypothetical protein